MSAPTMPAPALDDPMTMRRHPDDDPHDPQARRAIRADRGPLPWLTVTGPDAGYPLSHEDVAAWPTTHPLTWSPAGLCDLAHDAHGGDPR